MQDYIPFVTILMVLQSLCPEHPALAFLASQASGRARALVQVLSSYVYSRVWRNSRLRTEHFTNMVSMRTLFLYV